jgi:hypothetical protein
MRISRFATTTCCLLAFSALSCFAADFEIHLINIPPDALPGTRLPLAAEVSNVSGKPVTIAKGYRGFDVKFEIRRADGKPRKDFTKPAYIEVHLGYKTETLPPGWKATYRDEAHCDDFPGEWLVKAVLSSHGPYLQKDGTRVQGWEGDVASPEATVKVLAPTGLDEKAYKSTNGFPLAKADIVLRDFPTSTYAAYVIYGKMVGFSTQDPSTLLGIIEGGDSYNSNGYPCGPGDSKEGGKWLKGQAAADWWAEWYDVILKNHPDIWFADEMRLKKAVDRISVKDYQAAETDLKALAQNPKSPSKDRAQQYLDLMKQKGLIKN